MEIDLIFWGKRFEKKLIKMTIGVRTPTMYKGDSTGETFFKK